MNDTAWFRPKRIGFGISPANWKGWAFTFGMLAALAILRRLLLPSDPRGFGFLLVAWIALAIFVVKTKGTANKSLGEQSSGDH